MLLTAIESCVTELKFEGAKLSGDAGLLGAPLADVEKVKHGVSLGEKLEDDFAAARAHFSSKANFIASKAGSIGEIRPQLLPTYLALKRGSLNHV